MKFEFRPDVPLKNPKYKENHLVFIFDEDIFHMSQEDLQALLNQCLRVVDEHINKFANDNGGVIFPGRIVCDLSNIPSNESEVTNSGFDFVQSIALYTAEQIIGAENMHGGRKKASQKGAPKLVVDAKDAPRDVKDNIRHGGCWGCMGIMVNLGEDEDESAM